tara:strand:+ start:2754 stop:5315 length:2562 start_codon:yes stop_codon:yes gene_type:complete
MNVQAKNILIFIIIAILYLCFFIKSESEQFTIGLASGKGGNGTNFTSDELLESSVPCCKGDTACEGKRELLKETIDTDHKTLKEKAAEAAEDADGSVPFESDSPTSALWFFSNYRPLASCDDCKGLGTLPLRFDVTDEELMSSSTGRSLVGKYSQGNIDVQKEGIIRNVDITDKEGRSDDYKPSREWIAATCLEDPDCVGFELDRSENTARLVGYGSTLQQIEDDGDGKVDESGVEKPATDMYFLHPYRALKWQLEGKSAPGLKETQGDPKEGFQWKARIAKLNKMQPRFDDNERHDQQDVLSTIPYKVSPYTANDVTRYGNTTDIAQASKTIVERREERQLAKDRAAAEALIKIAKASKEKINKTLNSYVLATNNAKNLYDQSVRTVTVNTNNYDAWNREAGTRNTTKNSYWNSLNSANGSVTRAKASYDEAVRNETHYRNERDKYQRYRDAHNTERVRWQHNMSHHSVDYSNHYKNHWQTLKDQAQAIRDPQVTSFSQKKAKYSGGGWKDDIETSHGGGLVAGKNPAIAACKAKYAQVWPNISATERDAALSCKQKKKENKCVKRKKGECKEYKNHFKYKVHKNEYKLFKADTTSERAAMKKWGWKGTKSGDCNWKSINSKNLSKGGHKTDCGDCRDNSGCHSGTYGTHWGLLSHRKDQVDYWNGQRKKAQTEVDKQWKKYNEDEKTRKKREANRVTWAGHKSTRYNTKIRAEANQRNWQSWYNSAVSKYNEAVRNKNNFWNIKVNSETYKSTKAAEYTTAQSNYNAQIAEITRLDKVIADQERALSGRFSNVVSAQSSVQTAASSSSSTSEFANHECLTRTTKNKCRNCCGNKFSGNKKNRCKTACDEAY